MFSLGYIFSLSASTFTCLEPHPNQISSLIARLATERIILAGHEVCLGFFVLMVGSATFATCTNLLLLSLVKSLAANRTPGWRRALAGGGQAIVRCRAGPLSVGIGRVAPQVTIPVLHDAAKDRRYHGTEGHTLLSPYSVRSLPNVWAEYEHHLPLTSRNLKRLDQRDLGITWRRLSSMLLMSDFDIHTMHLYIFLISQFSILAILVSPVFIELSHTPGCQD